MFSFASPFFIYWCAAALIPLVLHLLQSNRTIRMPFSTLRFLKIAQKRSSRRIKMENFILWLLRTLVFLLLALAFAMPVLRTSDFGEFFGRSARDIALVIDNSYSLGYKSNGKVAWNEVIDVASTIISELTDKDRFCIYLAGNQVTPVYEQLSSGKDDAINRLKALKMGFTSSQLAPAIMEANKALEQEKRRTEREIHIVSDMQALPWSDFKPQAQSESAKIELPDKKDKKDKKETKDKPGEAKAGSSGKKDADKDAKGGSRETGGGSFTGRISAAESVWDASRINDRTTVFVTLVGAPTPENVSPIDVELEPRLIMADIPPQVSVQLSRTGPQTETTVTISVDDKEVARRSLMVGDGSSSRLSFTLPGVTPGLHIAWAETPEDGLLADNRFYFLIRCKAKLPTLCVGTKEDSGFLQMALSAAVGGGSSIEYKNIAVSQLSEEQLQAYVCIFLCNALPLPGQEIVRLEQYVRAGGTVVIFPGDAADAGAYAAWSSLPLNPLGNEDIPISDRKRMLRWEKPRHMIFSAFKLDAPAPVLAVRRGFKTDKLTEKAEALITTGAGIPFLVSKQSGNGEFMMFNVSANRTWSDFPLSPYFLPLMHQIVQYTAGIGSFNHYIWTTDSLPLQEYLPEATKDTLLKNPDGADVSVRSAVSEGRTILHAEGLMIPGVYTMSSIAMPASKPALAVNMERLESNLAPINQGDIPKIMGIKTVQVCRGKEELLRKLKDLRVGKALGEHILWLAFILAIIEFAYANMLSRKAPKLTDKLVVKESGKIDEQSSREAAAS